MASSELTLQGLPGDRRYAFVQAASRSSFPWLTARELPELVCYLTSVEENGASEPNVTVTLPTGEKWPVESEALRQALETRSGLALFLLFTNRGCYDAAPVSLISCQTTARIAEESATEDDPWRFRPNLLVDLESREPFDEMNWVGRILRAGSARIAITNVDFRCMIINLDPATGKASPSVLRSVAQQHGRGAGVYGTVLTPGTVRLGDALTMEA